MNLLLLIPLSLVIGIFIYFLIGGYILAIVFFLIWLDNLVLRFLIPGMTGIEFITLGTVLAGIVAGPTVGAILMFITIPLIGGIRSVILPSMSDIPPFVPAPANIIDALVAFTAGYLSHAPLTLLLPLLLLLKILANARIEKTIYDKPINITEAVAKFIFNVIFIYFFGNQLNALVS